ncbi:hypothetical protein K7432_012673 [Basidiobolus ranarum]|uniref:Uncharacterized protein n=1 Tax=Basidiobolus ranarum TaxID=34480 RepID=A0ABR2VSB9_9FUNG
MLPDLYISKKRHLYQHFHTTLQLRYPQLNELKKLRMNDLDIDMLSILSKERFTSEYPRSLIEEVLDDFQLEYADSPNQLLGVRDDFIDFLVQQRPIPNLTPDTRNTPLPSTSKLILPHKTNSIQSWSSESSIPVTETSTKESSQRDSSEYSTIQTDDGGYSPSMALRPLPLLPIVPKGSNQETNSVNINRGMWMSSE